MPFTRPTITQLINRAKSDIETRLPGADARLRNSVESVLARMSSGAVHGLHGHLVWLSRQIMPDTAEVEFAERWADIWGLTRNTTVQATGSLTVTGTNTTVCPAGTVWQDNNGELYDQDADVTIALGTATAALTARDGGTDGNQSVGATLTLVTPIAGIDSDGTVAGSGLIGGTDAETDAALLVRLLARLQQPPTGGGPGDYVSWAKAVTGVTRAWQYPNRDGLGTVAVFFVRDGDYTLKAGDSGIIPSAGEVAAVQAYIDAVAPVTADVTVYAPTAVDLDMTINLLPNTSTVQDAVEAEIAAYLVREAEPGVTLLISQMNEAVSIAPGETDHIITVPAANKTHTAAQLPVTGTYTWPGVP